MPLRVDVGAAFTEIRTSATYGREIGETDACVDIVP